MRKIEKKVPIISVAVTDDECLQMKEVARRLNCSLAQAYRLANDGLIPALRVRGMIRVPRAPLMAWIARNTSGGQEIQ